MKKTTSIFFLFCLFILTGCPGGNYKNALKKIQDNNMDFPDNRKVIYNGISFEISDLFRNSYNDYFCIQDNAETKSIYDMDLNFSVEVFDEDEAELIGYQFDEEIEALDAIHDNYIIRRKESLNEADISIKKGTLESVGFLGYIQIINGVEYEYSESISYFTATLHIENEFYVFQLIGKEDNMGYLYDDFLDILSSVEK